MVRLEPLRGAAPLVLWVFLLGVACGAPRNEGFTGAGTTAAERLDEARSLALVYLPDGVLCDILGLGGGEPFGDGLCPNWTYSFYSASEGAVVGIHLGPDGLFSVEGEPEKLPPGRSPPAWDGAFSVDSDFAAKSARIAGAGEFLSGGTPVSERLHLTAGTHGGETMPVWEVSYTLHDGGGFESYTVIVDAAGGGVLEDGSEPNAGADR
jgi:hypothetical protein